MSPINGSLNVDRFVREEGETVLHQVGMQCFCMGKDGQKDPNCRAHDFTGSVYGDPQKIIGLFTDITQRKELLSIKGEGGVGFFLPGDALFSPLTKDIVSEGDKITLLKPLPYGRGDALIRGNTDADRLLYRPASSILCMDEDKKVYRYGIDFSFKDKAIIWSWPGKEGMKPAIGRRYTVKYKAYLEWIAFFPPMERFSHGDDLGSKVMLRKLHIMKAQG